MSDRDTLADLIGAQGYDLDRGPRVPDWPEDERDIHRQYGWASFDDRATAMQEYRREKLAASILAAGWCRPACIVSEDEANRLLPGAIVRRGGKAWEREHDLWWHGGVLEGYAVPYGSGPITVLYDPAEEAGHA